MSNVNPSLAARYLRIFRSELREDEVLITASAAINVMVSEMLGRGAGDGTLGVTNKRLIHVGSRLGTLGIERFRILSASKKWIVLPGSSQLDVFEKQADASSLKVSFYCGSGFCRDVLQLLAK
jgi:hypothetical protein